MAPDQTPGGVTGARRWPLLIVGPALIAEVLSIWFGLKHEWFSSILQTECVAVALFAIALLGMAGYTGKRALLIVLAGGFVLQLAALASPPTTSDDVYRYVWDGKMQLAGIDPYRYPPSAGQLDRLRGDTLFYTAPNARADAKCAWHIPDGRCSQVNRPEVHTIYPPVAEGAFTLARLGSFGQSDGPFPLQVLATLGVLVASGLLAVWGRARSQRPWQLALWAWCPVTAVELANNGHIDWLAALASAAALVAYRRRRGLLAGGLLGAAIATKLYPGLLLPAMLRVQPRRVIAGAAGLVVLSYLPHIAAVGGSVIGYLPGYLKEEDYTNGGRFLLLAKVVPQSALTTAAVICLLLAAWWAIRRTDPDVPEQAAVLMIGVGLLVATPSYSWYSVTLLILVAMTGRIEWLPLVIAPTIANLGAHHFGNGVDYRTMCYGIGLICAVAGALVRSDLFQRRKPQHQPLRAE